MYKMETETNHLIAKELVELLMKHDKMYALGYLEGMIKTEMNSNPRFREEVIRHLYTQKRRAA
jgi:hypothetical protein